MAEQKASASAKTFGQKLKRALWISWLITEHVSDRIFDAVARHARVVYGEADLFLGAGLMLIGLLHFENGKNCDGNTAEYLSCTRPSTFYYYNWLEILVVVVGAYLVILWFLRTFRPNVSK